jgi:hypothetical protein
MGDQVQVERPRSVHRRAQPAKPVLDLVQLRQNILRRKGRIDNDDAVDVLRIARGQARQRIATIRTA